MGQLDAGSGELTNPLIDWDNSKFLPQNSGQSKFKLQKLM